MSEGTGKAEEPGAQVRELFGPAFGTVERFAGMLAAEGELRGLIGPRELPRLWTRHLTNSAAVAPFVGERDSVIDVGSGAGFPGIVVAAMRPDARVDLVEPMARRVEWLREVATALELRNVTVHRGRAETFHGQLSARIVTARAVAPLETLAGWTMPLVESGGRLLALKGERALDEIESAAEVIAALDGAHTEIRHVTPVPGGETARVVVVRKR